MDKWSYFPQPLLRNPAVRVSFVCAMPRLHIKGSNLMAETMLHIGQATVHTHHCYCKFALRLQHAKMFTGIILASYHNRLR